MVLSGVRDTVRQTLVKAGIDRLVGEDHVCSHISQAVVMANRIASASGPSSTDKEPVTLA